MIKNSMLRVKKYLDRLSTAKGYDRECIHSFLEGEDVETPLLVSDLKALCQFASSTIDANTPTLQAQADARDAARYRWLRNQMLGVDFDWCGNGITALVFEVPDGCAYSRNCDQSIDAAIAAQAKQGEPNP